MEGFRHRFPVEVRFRDIDVMGHVNNAVYLTYLESARIDYFVRVVFANPHHALPHLGIILAEIACTFKRPIQYGQRVEVGTRVVRMGNASYQVEGCIEADGELAAMARYVLVHYDYAAARSVRIPDDIRARIMAFEHLAE